MLRFHSGLCLRALTPKFSRYIKFYIILSRSPCWLRDTVEHQVEALSTIFTVNKQFWYLQRKHKNPEGTSEFELKETTCDHVANEDHLQSVYEKSTNGVSKT